MHPAVLVVEDDLATRNLLRVVLNRYEFDVDAVGSGVDVMTLLSAVEYSALLFDLYVRGDSGHELLASLVESRPDILTRIVVVSSAPKQDLDAIRKKHPMICVLRKPFDLHELVDSVKSAAVKTPARDIVAEFCRLSIVGGAKAGAVRTPSEDGAQLHVAMSYGYTDAMLDPYASVAIDGHYPVCTAYRRQRAVWFASVKLASAEYPLLVPIWEANHCHAIAALPLMNDGKCVGVAGWSFRDARPFEAEERRQFEEIAAYLAINVDKVRSTAKAS